MRALLVLGYLPIVLLTLTNAFGPHGARKKLKNDCNSIPEKWPTSQKMVPHTNQDVFGDAPFFRLTTLSDISIVEPYSTHTIQLVPTDSQKNISRFIVWTETQESDCDSALTGLSEICGHPKEKCHNVLVYQSSEEGSLMGDISFEWQAGTCGYHHIQVKVVDIDQQIYSPESDPFEALSIASFVDAASGPSLP